MILDIEGAELKVIQTLPWDKIDITILQIESNHMGEIFDGGRDELRQFLFDKGYRFYQKAAFDDIFVKKSVLDSLLSKKI